MPVPSETAHADTPRHSRPQPSRARLWVWIGVVVAVAIGAGIIAAALWGSSNEPADKQVAPAPASPSAEPSPTPAQSNTAAPGLTPGEVVVESGEDGIDLFESAGDEEPADHLPKWTALGSTTTLLGFDRTTIGDQTWIEVELPEAPNHRRAWVREGDVTISSTDARIDVYLDERELDFSVDGEVKVTNSVVIGAPESPTPLGVFWVTDPLDFTPNPTGVYGAFALGMNGWSETLETFNGGPPQLAIHGTNQPELLGENVSNGCIRLPNDVILDIAELAAPGTPVVVHQSRTA